MKCPQFYCTALIVMLVILEGIRTDAAPSIHNDDLLTLLNLERKYAAIARPSLRSESTKATRSVYMEPKALRVINIRTLQKLDNMYADKSRPRFGKRADDGFNYQAPDYEGQEFQAKDSTFNEWVPVRR